MQALGSYEGGKMLFIGLGTGLGSALVANGFVQPMELGHLPYKKATFEDYARAAGERATRRQRRCLQRWVPALGPGGARPDRGLADDAQTAVEAEVPLACA